MGYGNYFNGVVGGGISMSITGLFSRCILETENAD